MTWFGLTEVMEERKKNSPHFVYAEISLSQQLKACSVLRYEYDYNVDWVERSIYYKPLIPRKANK